tara:strand:- start:27 stop:206 length:180 start_codon:yes stop_codon:yes gene_type:complete
MNYKLLNSITLPSGTIEAGEIVKATLMMNSATGETYYNCWDRSGGLGFFKVKPSDLEEC